MKFPLLLALIWLLTIAAGIPVQADTFSADGNMIGLLAQAIATQATTNDTFAPAYRVADANGHLFVMPATIAFELLSRTVMTWKPDAHFPATVAGLTYNLPPPTYDPTLEPPAGPPVTIPVLTQDIADGAKTVNTGIVVNTIRFGTYRLTASQFAVAMAMFITSWQTTGHVPDSLAVPAVPSPHDWTDISTPLSLAPETHTDPISLRVLINGIELPRGDDTPMPAGLTQPVDGTVGIALIGSGPIAKISLAVDGVEFATFSSAGMHGFSLDTQHLTDDTHLLTITAHGSETDNSPIAIVLSLNVKNGRDSALNPAETD